MVRKTALAAFAVGMLEISGAFAQPADADRGAGIAARWCANCHAIAPAQRRNDADPPELSRIGRQPDFDAAKLTAFLMTPHPRMPDMSLSRREIEDLVAFIRAQAK
ncbi:MAG: c-type cytochrome [Beijerinckiaceae bacterium]